MWTISGEAAVDGRVITAASLIRHDYYLAEIMARFGGEIDAAFGPHLQQLREACFTTEQLERFHEQVNRG